MVYTNRRFLGVGCVLVLSTFHSSLDAQDRAKSTERIDVQVRDLRAQWRPLDDPDVASIALHFRMTVRNLRTKPAEIGNSEWNTIGVQSRCEGIEQWTQVISSRAYYDLSLDYPACISVKPGSARDVRKVESGVITLRRLLPDLAKCEFRLQLEGLCRRTETGQLTFDSLVTSPFRIKIKTPSPRPAR